MNVKIVAFVVMLILCITIVSGETISGNFTESSIASYNFHYMASTTTDNELSWLSVTNIQNTNGISAIVYFPDNVGMLAYTYTANKSGQTAVKYSIGTTQIGEGTIGYQRLYDALGVEIPGYIYWTFSSWNPTSYTGEQIINVSYNYNLLGQRFTPHRWNAGSVDTGTTPTGYFIGANNEGRRAQGYYIENFNFQWKNSYDITSPSGLGSVGSIHKYLGGVYYSSKVFVVNPLTESIIASDSAYNVNSLSFNTIQTKMKIAILDAVGNWHNSSTLFDIPTTYYLDVVPISGSINDNFTYKISSSTGYLTDIKYIDLMDGTNGTNTNLINPLGNYYHNYLKNNSGYWNAYNPTILNEYGTYGGYVTNIGTTLPNNLPFKFKQGGNRTVKIVLIDTSEKEYIAYAYVNINDAGKYSVNLYPIDYVNNNFISGATISVQSYPERVWSNITIYSPEDAHWLLNLGFYNIFASATGYKDKYWGALYVNEDKSEQIVLYPEDTTTGDITNSTVYIGVKDGIKLTPISGAIVSVNLGGGNTKTSNSGVAVFILQNGTKYEVTASVSGYQSTKVTFTPNAASYSFDIAMGSSGVVPTAITPIPIATATYAPVITPAKWDNKNKTSCQIVMPDNATPIQRLMNGVSCLGVENSQDQSLALAGLIVMIFVAAGAKYGKGIGAAVGSVCGFILSLAAGLIPVWVFFALLLILGLVLAVYMLNR